MEHLSRKEETKKVYRMTIYTYSQTWVKQAPKSQTMVA